MHFPPLQSGPLHRECDGGLGSSGSFQLSFETVSSQSVKQGASQKDLHSVPQFEVQVGAGGPPCVHVITGVGTSTGKEVVDQGQGGGKKVRSSEPVMVT